MMLSLQRSTLEQHRKFLQRLCRTCGKKTMKESDEAKGKKAKLTVVYEDKIKNVFRVDLRDDDNVNVHPPHICHVCYSRLFLRRTQAADPQPLLWQPHPRTGQCSICSDCNEQSKGGRPPKSIHPGRPKSQPITIDSHFEQLRSSMSNASILNTADLSKFSATCCTFLCKLCNKLLRFPVATPCEHVFCTACIRAIYTKENKVKCPCPICDSLTHYKQIDNVRAYFWETLNKSSLKCNYCNIVLPLSEIEGHKCNLILDLSVSREIHDALQEPLITTPLSQTLEKLGTRILKSKLAQSSDGISAAFKTGGQVGI